VIDLWAKKLELNQLTKRDRELIEAAAKPGKANPKLLQLFKKRYKGPGNPEHIMTNICTAIVEQLIEGHRVRLRIGSFWVVEKFPLVVADTEHVIVRQLSILFKARTTLKTLIRQVAHDHERDLTPQILRRVAINTGRRFKIRIRDRERKRSRKVLKPRVKRPTVVR
jgi:hypothetical protein